jgi:translation initiation factor IF-3
MFSSAKSRVLFHESRFFYQFRRKLEKLWVCLEGIVLKHNDQVRVRINGNIRAKNVRLIGPEGEVMGVVAIKIALEKAAEFELDLIEVAPKAEPPVCKIGSYSKWRYEAEQKQKEKRRNHVETKEMKFNVRIGDGDLQVKCRKINEMLDEGDHVRVVVQMKGREKTHPELAKSLMEKIISHTANNGAIEGKISEDASRISLQLMPKKR